MIRLRQTDDVDAIRELHESPETTFAGTWIDSAMAEHTFWELRDGPDLIGFCSAYFYPDRGCVFLSRAYVAKEYAGHGLQRRMIRARVAWARTVAGCNRCVTYAYYKNALSIVNLLRSGFRIYTPPTSWGGEHSIYFRLTF